jgi:rRNA-processing protein FCF1
LGEVFIDTSSILFGFSNKRDVFESVRGMFPSATTVISKGVIRELRGLSGNKGRKGSNARAALIAVKAKKVKVDNNTGNVDRWILSAAASTPDSVVITNDTDLGRALKRKGTVVFKISRDGSLR